MRKPICVPASVHLCTPSICPKQPDMEVQGKGESKGCLHQAGLCSGCAGHGSMCSIRKKGDGREIPPCHPSIIREKLSTKHVPIFCPM